MTGGNKGGLRSGLRRRASLAAIAVAGWGALPGGGAALAQEQLAANESDVILVTSRRVSEDVQDVPIPVSVVSGDLINESGTDTVLQLEQLVPSFQIFSSNPRNTALNIRGLGTTFGLTNDGVEIGVGLYVDDVFWARPAQATLDFLDIEQIEVLRGPQGTLYGKNTTAGAIKITTKRPSFDPQTDVELSYGDYGYIQAKASITGPLLGNKVAGRISFSGTQRDGFLKQVASDPDFRNTGDDLNDLNNLGVRGSALWDVADGLEVIFAGDYTRQRPEGYAQVPVRVGPTLRAQFKHYFEIADEFGYTTPQPIVYQEPRGSTGGIYAEFDPFVRVTDADTPHRSYQDIDGQSITVNWDVGPGTLTSVTARRNWYWYPSNDRDFIGLPIVTQSANRSNQKQWTQEFRYAGDLSDRLSFVAGLFYFDQSVETHNTQSHGSAAWRWVPTNPFVTFPAGVTPPDGTAIVGDQPGLIDGLTQYQNVFTDGTSAALFGQVEWRVTDKLRIIPGIRLNYDEKSLSYEAPVVGGLDLSGFSPAVAAALQTFKNSVVAATPLIDVGDDDTNVSGQLTLAYDFTDDVNAYATYATSFKTFGVNSGGAPTRDAYIVDPEEVTHYEAGVKTRPFDGATLNFTVYNTEIEDYQAQVVNSSTGLLRGFLANADKVRVRGAELDASARPTDSLSLYASLAYTDGKYVSFPDAPAPPELQTSSTSVVDASGTRLPGLSEWAGSVGGEYLLPGAFLGREGDWFVGVDASYRSDFSSAPIESIYMNVDGYSLVNARVGFKASDRWSVYAWGRNLADTEYFEILAAQSGGTGLIVGSLGDPRTVGVTLTGSF